MRMTDVHDEKVKQIALTLKSSGLASSESEAIRMAMNMTNTTNRVNDNFEKKKDWATMGISNLKKDYPKKDDHQPNQQHASQPSGQAMHHVEHAPAAKSEMHNVDQIVDLAPGDEAMKQELVGEPAQAPAPAHPVQEAYVDKSLKDLKVSDAVAKPDGKGEEEEVLVEKTVQLPGNERNPKRDTSKMTEAKVDLSAMFKFK